MIAPLLIVKEAQPARGGGVVLTPRITLGVSDSSAPFTARLVRPDGTERTAAAALDVAHIRGPQGAFALVRLLEVDASEVPAGTQIWRV